MKFIIYSFLIISLLQGVSTWFILPTVSRPTGEDKPCTYNGIEYAHGANVPSNSHCTLCICQHTIVTCTALTCSSLPKGCRFSPTRTKCCDYECGCMHEDKEYSHGDFVSTPNPCITCKCFNGTIVCTEFKECAPLPPRCERYFNETKCCAYICSGEPDCREVRCEPPPHGCTHSPQPHDCCAYTCRKLIDCTNIKCYEPPKGCKRVPNRETCCDFDCYIESTQNCADVTCSALPNLCTYLKETRECCAFSCTAAASTHLHTPEIYSYTFPDARDE